MVLELEAVMSKLGLAVRESQLLLRRYVVLTGQCRV
jgi:hypothetical protein